ncbi:hypothetical protein AC482_01190 [miscellaneous Crenarchaeota group-15 archaeon DG-45]|uniref:Uncharacterized protein n=1 Tax=miscellaneous Crenarchaeota group-15 archaeon DG-45 TaxID=1685127 RepID=A0A0M0BSY4_9ARCH|nr:MAG: hypothetical protein AC482_01190 [miscellaneous Crenarchaeota group-15 archaeon DG-45]
MVVTKSKFICGDGPVTIYYCKFCGSIHLSAEQAEKCERGNGCHAGRLGEPKLMMEDFSSRK